MTGAAWDSLATAMRGCVACPELAATRRSVVVGSAPAGARILLVGEAPGAQEDEAGVPFVGKSGQLLDRLLAEAGLQRSDVAVANVLKCRPPGNRAPRSAEVASCRGWLDRQLDVIAPSIVCTLGLAAMTWFLGRGRTLASVRGQVHEVGRWRVLPTYHPSAAIRFGPQGMPMAALRDDLVLLAGQV